MKKSLTKLKLFLLRHKMFSLFFLGYFFICGYLLLSTSGKETDFLTCSAFDKGPLGSYSFYHELEKAGVDVQRLELSLFQHLDEEKDSGKTLIILSPIYFPKTWEWEKILKWTAAGNRLITSGSFNNIFGKNNFNIFLNEDITIRTRNIDPSPIHVVLPVDSRFPYPEKLNPASQWLFPQRNKEKNISTYPIQYISNLASNMLPLLVQDGKVISSKKLIGKGQWIMFSMRNPFGHNVLKDTSWFNFSTKLIIGDPQFNNQKVYFDEYHNGYKATQSLWTLLEYFKFDKGLILLGLVILIYLFFNGIRILSPRPILPGFSKDILPGLHSMSRLLYKHKAWNELIRNEFNELKKEFNINEKSTEPGMKFVTIFNYKHGIPKEFPSKKDFENRIKQLEDKKPFTKKEAIQNFNLLVSMRKELRL